MWAARGRSTGGQVKFLVRLTGTINHVHLLDSDVRRRARGELGAHHAPCAVRSGGGGLRSTHASPRRRRRRHHWWAVDLRFWPDAWQATEVSSASWTSWPGASSPDLSPAEQDVCARATGVGLRLACRSGGANQARLLVSLVCVVVWPCGPARAREIARPTGSRDRRPLVSLRPCGIPSLGGSVVLPWWSLSGC